MMVFRRLLALGLALGFLLQAAAPQMPARAQDEPPPIGLQWAPPRPVPGYYPDAFAPYLIADQNNTVHAFNSTQMGNLLVVVYSQWTETTGWSTPVDILISPIKRQARLQGAVLDEAGWVHLVFYGGDDLGASIYYSKAPLVQAGNAQAWTKPALIGDEAIAPTNAALATDGKGNLYMVYSSERDGIGLYANYSVDGGDTWMEPVTVFQEEDEEQWPTALQLHLDENGALHTTWTVVNITGNGEEIYYARLEPETRTWTDPVVLATRDPGDYEVDWASIVSHEGRLILMYQDSFPATRWMRISDDGGHSWSNPILPFDFVGEYRHVAYVKDSRGILHMFLGNRTEDAVHGMWHTIWLGDNWRDLEPVVAGPRVTEGPLEQRFDPTGPSAAVANGSTILLTWSTDPGAGRNGVWYSHAKLSTPALPATPLPTPVIVPTATRIPDFAAIQAPERTPPSVELEDGEAPDETALDPAMLITLGLAPALFLLGGVIWYEKRRLNRRN